MPLIIDKDKLILPILYSQYNLNHVLTISQYFDQTRISILLH